MAGETFLTVIGNLTADPELRFTPSGKCVADFTVASTPRFFDRGANEWKDGESLFMRCSLWGEAAENVSESLRKGMRVIAVGRLNQRSFETKSGEHRSVVELQVDEVGPSLRRAKAQVVRSQAAQPGSYVNAYSGQQTQGVYQPQQQAQPPRQEAAPPQQQVQPPQQEYQQPAPAQVRSTTVESQGVGQGSPFNYSQQQRQEQPPQGWGSYGAPEEPPF